MMKISLFLLILLFMLTSGASAQNKPAATASQAQTPKEAKAGAKASGKQVNPPEKKPETPKVFWRAQLPEVTGDMEKRYDLNRDGILQPAETIILLRDTLDDIAQKQLSPIEDSALLKMYDKNKDGQLSILEAEEIKKDLKD